MMRVRAALRRPARHEFVDRSRNLANHLHLIGVLNRFPPVLDRVFQLPIRPGSIRRKSIGGAVLNHSINNNDGRSGPECAQIACFFPDALHGQDSRPTPPVPLSGFSFYILPTQDQACFAGPSSRISGGPPAFPLFPPFNPREKNGLIVRHTPRGFPERIGKSPKEFANQVAGPRCGRQDLVPPRAIS